MKKGEILFFQNYFCSLSKMCVVYPKYFLTKTNKRRFFAIFSKKLTFLVQFDIKNPNANPCKEREIQCMLKATRCCSIIPYLLINVDRLANKVVVHNIMLFKFG